MNTENVCAHCSRKIVYMNSIGWCHRDTVSVWCGLDASDRAVPRKIRRITESESRLMDGNR